ncbi:MAG: phosphoribosylformylglycinamidine synthase subunit PurQ, partial [Pseudomonadota bacterium]
RFFTNPAKFGLGVCNGCQMMAQLRDFIPGAHAWPRFAKNRSEQFEARLTMAEVPPNHSVFLHDMANARLPVAIAHGEGRAVFDNEQSLAYAESNGLICLRFINDRDEPAVAYPDNPNGSTNGVTGLCTPDGRFTIMMPHPERIFRAAQCSWHPSDWDEYSPWFRMFQNARAWLA